MQEQEPSVNDILSSIRQILSNKIEDDAPSSESGVGTLSSVASTPEVTEDAPDLSDVSNVFLLTPQMRTDGQTDVPVHSAIVDSQSAHQSDGKEGDVFTPTVSEQDIKPMVQDWLDKNLPALVEKIVAEEVRRIFNKR